MEKSGIVVEVLGEKAKIRVERDSSCGGNCGHCMGCDNNAVFVYALNQNLKVGEEVRVVMKDKNFLSIVLITYILPTFILFFCSLLIYNLTHNELFSFLGGAAGIVVFFLFYKLISKKFLQKNDNKLVKIEKNSVQSRDNVL